MSQIHDRCQRCHRVLKNPIYRKIGFGKVCLGKAEINPEQRTDLQQQLEKMLLEMKEEKKRKSAEIPTG